MARSVGLDIPRHSIEVGALDDKGGVVDRGRTGCLGAEREACARAHLEEIARVA